MGRTRVTIPWIIQDQFLEALSVPELCSLYNNNNNNNIVSLCHTQIFLMNSMSLTPR